MLYHTLLTATLVLMCFSLGFLAAMLMDNKVVESKEARIAELKKDIRVLKDREKARNADIWTEEELDKLLCIGNYAGNDIKFGGF